MNKEEFEALTGNKVEDEEFAYINSVYLHTVYEKEEFCKYWKKKELHGILKEVHTRAVNFELETKRLQGIIKKISLFLLDKAELHGDRELYQEAVKIIGKKETISYKIEKGMTLYDDEKNYLMGILK